MPCFWDEKGRKQLTKVGLIKFDRTTGEEMKVTFLAFWLLGILGNEPPELSAIRSFKKGQLEHAALKLHLASWQIRRRRQRWSHWNEQRVRIAYLAGRIALMRKRPKEAIRWLEKASRYPSFFPKYIRIYLIDAYIAAGLWKKAVFLAQKSMKELGGRYFRRKMRRRIIRAYQKGKAWKELANFWRRLLWYPRPYGGRRHVMWQMTQNYVRAGIHDKAVRWLIKFALDYPTAPQTKQALDWLATWSQKKKLRHYPFDEGQFLYRLYRMTIFHPTLALKKIEKELSSNKQYSASSKEYLLRLKGKCLMRLRRYREAIPLWKKLKKKGSMASIRRKATKQLGRCYVELGAFQQALKVFSEYADKAPETDIAEYAANQSAWLAIQLQKYKQARRYFREYRTLYPNSWRSRNIDWHIAWTFFREGQYRKAISLFKIWGQKKPSYARLRQTNYWIARAYERKGYWRKAKELYLKVSKGAPFSYYGIQAQRRLHLLIDHLGNYGKEKACWLDRQGYHQKIAFKPEHLFGLTKKYRKKTLSILDPRVFGVANIWQFTSPKKGPLMVDEPLVKRAPFPEVPRFCRHSPKSRSCRHLRTAALFHRLGFKKDAIAELYDARWLLRYNQARLLESVRWLLSVKGYHEALRLSLFLKWPRYKRSLKLYNTLKLRYPRVFIKPVLKQSRRFKVPFSFTWAIMREESHFKVSSRSWVGARGLMQIMPSTGRKIARRLHLKHFHPKQLYQPQTNIMMGCWYLGELLKKFEGNVMLAAASYNAGPHRVAAWLQFRNSLDADEFVEEIPFQETRKYVKRVFRSYMIYNFLYHRRTPAPSTAVAVRIGQNIDF